MKTLIIQDFTKSSYVAHVKRSIRNQLTAELTLLESKQSTSNSQEESKRSLRNNRQENFSAKEANSARSGSGSKDGEGASNSDESAEGGGDGDDEPPNCTTPLSLQISLKICNEYKPLNLSRLFLETFLKEVAKLPFMILTGIVAGITVVVVLTLLGIRP